MLEKSILNYALARHLQQVSMCVQYWDGQRVNYGQETPARVTVHLKTPAAGRAVLLRGSVGFGEAYADGAIEIDGALDELSKSNAQSLDRPTWFDAATRWLFKQTNRKSKQKSQIQHHYDIGNAFYKLWLDQTMTYSCAYFRRPADSLEQAQEQKRGHILSKLALQPGMKLLDIGCGWGHLLFQAVRQYDVQGTGITLSQQQYEFCNGQARVLGLDSRLKFELINYQDLAATPQRFDRIVSVGMFEHVGKGNHANYFAAVRQMLKPDGLSLLHTISSPREYETNPWIDRYIFPGGYIPSSRSVVSRLPEYGFDFLDYENLRQHYALTLSQWLGRFDTHRQEVIASYGQKFYRMWRLYLGMSAGAFQAGLLDLSQFLFCGPRYVAPLTREYMYEQEMTQAFAGRPLPYSRSVASGSSRGNAYGQNGRPSSVSSRTGHSL